MTQALTQMLKAGALYCALVFGAGFVLGTFRVLWMVPRFGERTSELVEAPIKLLVTIFAAQWVVRRLAVSLLLRDPVSGSVYLALLVTYAIMPLLVARSRRAA